MPLFNFDRAYTYRILQLHRPVSLSQHGFLFGLWLQPTDNAGLLSKVSEEVATEIAKNVKVDNPTVALSFNVPFQMNPRQYPHIAYISRNKARIIDLHYAALIVYGSILNIFIQFFFLVGSVKCIFSERMRISRSRS